MSLAHADPERAVGRDAAVGVAVASVLDRGRDRHGLGARIDAVQALVVEVRDEGVPRWMQYAPPPYSCTEVRTLNPAGTTSACVAVGVASHENDAAGLGRTPLEPPDGAVLDPRRGQPDTGLRHHLRGDRRRPRSVGATVF